MAQSSLLEPTILETWQKAVRGKNDWSKRIRVHEAGHAVAGYLLGKHIQQIKIRTRYQRRNDHLQGQTNWTPLGRHWKLEYPRGFEWYIPKSVKRMLFDTVAGEVAEYWFFDDSRFMVADRVKMLDLMRLYVGNRKLAYHYWEEIRKEASEWFAKPRYMETVGAVANALQKKPVMSGREVERIIRMKGLKPPKKWTR